MLKNEKSANRDEHQNRKTEVFWPKNRKTDGKNSQNRKTENPNVPLLNIINRGVKSFKRCYHKVAYHDFGQSVGSTSDRDVSKDLFILRQ